MADILIIPAARFIPPELQLDFGLIPPVLLPLGTSTALDYITDSLSYDRCFVGLHDERERVETYINNKQLNAKTIFIETNNHLKSKQLGFTIKYMIEKSGVQPGDSIIVNFGDTIVLDEKRSLADNDKDIIYVSKMTDLFRWTIIDTGGEKIKFYDKNLQGKPESGYVIAGLFYIKDAVSFLAALNKEWEYQNINAEAGKDLFYLALERYLNDRNDLQVHQIRDGKWVDLGHLDTFYKSKANFLNARHFNSFDIDLFWGKVRKKSVHQSKFVNEINWYLGLPAGLKSLIPNVYTSSTGDAAYIEMEYYSYPTLNQIYLFSNISHSLWRDIFRKLLQIHAEFRNYPKGLSKESLKVFYFEKNKQRIEDLRKDRAFLPFFTQKIIINKKSYPSLDELLNSLEAFIDKFIMNTNVSGSIIHGDYCLSNILYDIKTGVVKLIDPRGSFIDASVYGDPRYDLAKLLHSVHGFYDLILTGNYKLEEDKDKGFSFEIFKTAEHESLSQMLIDLMQEKGINITQALAIESLLFLSMVPLHADDPKRQKAFLMRGMELYYSIQDNKI